MVDYDQGGHPQRTARVDLGASVGWAECPYRSLLILPSAQMSLAGPMAQPRLWLGPAIQIVDAGGFAGSFPITIQPISGAESIMGQAQIQINTNYGGLILMPISAQRTWVTVT